MLIAMLGHPANSLKMELEREPSPKILRPSLS